MRRKAEYIYKTYIFVVYDNVLKKYDNIEIIDKSKERAYNEYIKLKEESEVLFNIIEL